MIQTGAMKLRQSFHGKWIFWGNLRWAKDKSMADFFRFDRGAAGTENELGGKVAQAYFEPVALIMNWPLSVRDTECP